MTDDLDRKLAKEERRKKKKKKVVVNAAPPSMQEQLYTINGEIVSLEKEISMCADEFQKVRLDMMTGIVSFEGVQARDKIDLLAERLKELRKSRKAAMQKIDDVIFKIGSSLTEKEEEERKEKKKKDDIVKKEEESKGQESEGQEEKEKPKKRFKKEKKEESKGQEEEEIKVCSGGCKNLIYDSAASVDFCRDCGAVYDHRIDTNPANFAFGDVHFDGMPRRRGGGYKPPNHFAEILSQFQGKRRSYAPKEIVDAVRKYCERYGIPKHRITPLVVRQILKQLQQEETALFKWARKADRPKRDMIKYTDLYKHTPEISWTLSDIPPPYLQPSQQDKIVAWFPLAVAAYRTSPRYLARKANRMGRKKEEPNILNYYFMLYKLCQLAGYDEFLPYIPLPKSLANIEECDQNGWKHIAQVNGWAFCPTR
jgi:hypothetical protein